MSEIAKARPARQELTIHACDRGGFMVYGRAEEFAAFERGRPMAPIAAFSFLNEALSFVQVEMAPPPDKRHPS